MGKVRQQSKRDVARRMHERYLKAKCKADKTRLLDWPDPRKRIQVV